MEIKDKNRNSKSKEALKKDKADKEKKDKIKELMEKIKQNELFDSDLSKSIINCFIKKDFDSLTINEIIEILNLSIKFENETQKCNLRNDVMNKLKNNQIFCQGNKKYKYDLNLEKTVSFLTSFLDLNSNSNINNSDINSKKSKKSNSIYDDENTRFSPVFDFPKYQNEVAYIIPEENQQNLSYSNMDDNSFTFGEQSQIKINKANKQDEETLIELNEDEIKKIDLSSKEFEDLKYKALEKNMQEYDYLFDQNNYLSKLVENVEKLLKLYKKNNENKAKFDKFENNIKTLYSLNKEIQLKKSSFNKSSSSFNTDKLELSEISNLIQKQFIFIKFLLKTDFIQDKLISCEKETYKLYLEEFKKLFNEFLQSYRDIKSNEKEINGIITKIKLSLKGICETFLEKKEEYKEFCQYAKNIEKNESVPIKVNINESFKLFSCYINEFDKNFLEIVRNKD